MLYTEVLAKCFSHTTQAAEGEGRDWENEDPSIVEYDGVWDCLRNLKEHESLGPDDISPWALRETHSA